MNWQDVNKSSSCWASNYGYAADQQYLISELARPSLMVNQVKSHHFSDKDRREEKIFLIFM